MVESCKPKISIVIPVLYEPDLPVLLAELNLLLQDDPHEIIVVTSDKQRGSVIPVMPPVASSNVRVVKSYGDSLERAILLGFSVAEGEKIVVMDADGSHPAFLVLTLVNALDDYEMAVASRFISGGRYVTSPFRGFISWVFTKYAQLLGSSLSDPMTGFFGIRKSCVDGVRFKPIKWKVALEISNKGRPKTLEVPYLFVNRKVGRSKSSWKIGFKILWDILEVML